MKFITIFAGALAATTAANILLASDAHAFDPPNGWKQKGQSCSQNSVTYYKLYKLSGDTAIYGVYKTPSKSWVNKNMTLSEANRKLNSAKICNVGGSSEAYKPTEPT
jgi:hypothetical protein